MTITSDYVEAVMRRARHPMPPHGWETDWHDQPLRHKVYPGVHRLMLPSGLDTATAALGGCLLGSPPTTGAPASGLDMLGGLLRHSYGLLERRLRVTGNDDNDRRYWSQNTTWARGTASGGGLYPLEIYWVPGPSSPVLPGVYHYSSPHHAMERLLTGDVAEVVRSALPEPEPADGYLLVTVKFWKNSFKYNSFCYHVVTMDLGALLGTWRLWWESLGQRVTPRLWFHDEPINTLLGLDGVTESTFAVIPLPAAPGIAAQSRPGLGDVLGRPAVRRTEWERSSATHQFEQVDAVHGAALLTAVTAPPDTAEVSAQLPQRKGEAIVLPQPDFGRLDGGLGEVLRRRRSSFGGFVGLPELSQDDLSLMLASAARAARLPLDVRGTGELTRLCVYVNHVEALPQGVYDYDPSTGALNPVSDQPMGALLQRNYFLENYNLEQAAAVIAVMGRPVEVIEKLGERAYRAVNAEVGAITQTVYLAAAGLKLGCGAALGFDNESLAEMATVAETGEWPLIILMIGKERGDDANVDYQLA